MFGYGIIKIICKLLVASSWEALQNLPTRLSSLALFTWQVSASNATLSPFVLFAEERSGCNAPGSAFVIHYIELWVICIICFLLFIFLVVLVGVDADSDVNMQAYSGQNI